MGKDLKKIERITYLLGRLWVLVPQQRFFQLLINFTSLDTMGDEIYEFEDKELEKELKKAIEMVAKRGK